MKSDYPINTWEQVGHGGVFITYHTREPRSVRPPRAQVIRVGYKTDPDTHWSNNGHKTFAGKRAESVPKAKEWASQRYGITNWRRNSLGDWVDADKDYKPLRRDLERRKSH